MRFDVITGLPKLLESPFQESILKRAQSKGFVELVVHDLRDYAHDKHQVIDDTPYGGGAGMILKPEPIFKAVDVIRSENPSSLMRIVLMTPQGPTFNQAKAEELSKQNHLVFLCGHYRGVDERVIQGLVTDEISIGDYILSGGELPAAVVVDAVVRLLPGALSNADSAEGDSFMDGKLDHPHFTRPEEFRGMKVPEVLLSGHHANIEAWREQQALERTKTRRPDLFNPCDAPEKSIDK